jgi:hypothetical protein
MAVYLIRDGMYAYNNIQVYKIGISVQGYDSNGNLLRIKTGYSKGTEIFQIWEVSSNVYKIERDIIDLFKHDFKLSKGNEWFEGDVTEMEQCINYIIDMHENNNNGELKNKLVMIKSKAYKKLKEEYRRIEKKHEALCEEYKFVNDIDTKKTLLNFVNICREKLLIINEGLNARLKLDSIEDNNLIKIDDKWCFKELAKVNSSIKKYKDILWTTPLQHGCWRPSPM